MKSSFYPHDVFKIKALVLFSRKARSIAGITNQGVPIIEEPYMQRINRSRSSTDDSEANILSANGKNPKLKLTWDGSRRNYYGNRR